MAIMALLPVLFNYEKPSNTSIVLAEITVDSEQKKITLLVIYCRCLRTDKCKAYKYKETRQDNCLLIKQNSTAEEGQIFEQDAISEIYEKISSEESYTEINIGIYKTKLATSLFRFMF